MSVRRPRLHTLLVTAAVTAAASLSLTPLASAQTTPAASSTAAKPTVVLVHGAFADSSSWNGVVKRLQHDGYPVIAPANPLRGLAQDSTYIASVLASVKGPVVLVGHSYGGAVISQAAANDPQVKALVYIAALVPDTGENLGALANKFPGTNALNPSLRPIPFSNADGTGGSDLYVDPTLFRSVFAADLPASQTVVMAAEQRPIAAAAFAASPTAAAWHTIPSWALVAKQDQALGAPVERFEAQRAHSHTIEISSSHVAMISHPGTVTHLIEDAATTTR
ncbi:alpha/beta hydrolase [Streptomyces sp. So13.3]|uniref:alpha/beta fold hydrolase n=1 Tax=Streptomyces sp. So13.3 TaxID=2136173 RepID=UPI0011059E57|nr:alpha/beta hydrolase [Streptomyces sp. So13.3]QNA70682.1 alpha/beta hydrolase [Streptomyces sp. So13.3]